MKMANVTLTLIARTLDEEKHLACHIVRHPCSLCINCTPEPASLMLFPMPYFLWSVEGDHGLYCAGDAHVMAHLG